MTLQETKELTFGITPTILFLFSLLSMYLGGYGLGAILMGASYVSRIASPAHTL